jgi:hypothetical protein
MVTAMGVVCLGATVATATPASATTHKSISWVKTTDGSPGGKANFNNNGDKITVCDVESDGWAVRVRIYANFVNGNEVKDLSHDGNCVSKSFSSIPEGKGVRFEICLTKHMTPIGQKAYTLAKYCKYSPWGYA